LPDLLDDEDVVDVDLGHAGRGDAGTAVGDNLALSLPRV
jgi:hypothetical protein